MKRNEEKIVSIGIDCTQPSGRCVVIELDSGACIRLTGFEGLCYGQAMDRLGSLLLNGPKK
jgi:hypothetical protein